MYIRYYTQLRLHVTTSASFYPMMLLWGDRETVVNLKDIDGLFFLGNSRWQEHTLSGEIISDSEMFYDT